MGRENKLCPVLPQSKKVIRINEGEVIPAGARYLNTIIYQGKIISLYEVDIDVLEEKQHKAYEWGNSAPVETISKIINQDMEK
ncbi:MAG TPA: hypothetical protein VHO03_16765 [Ignavibacteriales bacterium]|nr:hypothetical protein [Ignavibacteriales bacterium]